jgi:hypothetical protein
VWAGVFVYSSKYQLKILRGDFLGQPLNSRGEPEGLALFRFLGIRSGQGHRGSCSDGVANQATDLPMGQVNIV